MTRDEFFRICESADRELEGDVLSLSIAISIERNLDRAVFIFGSWGEGMITRRELYRPTPGRQGSDCYQSANALCEAAKNKFLRWLEFYHDYIRIELMVSLP